MVAVLWAGSGNITLNIYCYLITGTCASGLGSPHRGKRRSSAPRCFARHHKYRFPPRFSSCFPPHPVLARTARSDRPGTPATQAAQRRQSRAASAPPPPLTGFLSRSFVGLASSWSTEHSTLDSRIFLDQASSYSPSLCLSISSFCLRARARSLLLPLALYHPPFILFSLSVSTFHHGAPLRFTRRTGQRSGRPELRCPPAASCE